VQEYGSLYIQNLYRGLRPFPNPRPGQEFLLDCYNFVPSELGLTAYEPFIPIGTSAPLVDYIRVRDQGGVVWYWLCDLDLNLIIEPTLPNLIPLGFDVNDITPTTVPYWLQVDAVDSLSTQMYVFPSAIDGTPLIDTSSPAVGSGYDVLEGLTFRAPSGWKHILKATSAQDLFVTQLGE
jgi:hypothetical protein